MRAVLDVVLAKNPSSDLGHRLLAIAPALQAQERAAAQGLVHRKAADLLPSTTSLKGNSAKHTFPRPDQKPWTELSVREMKAWQHGHPTARATAVQIVAAQAHQTCVRAERCFPSSDAWTRRCEIRRTAAAARSAASEPCETQHALELSTATATAERLESKLDSIRSLLHERAGRGCDDILSNDSSTCKYASAPEVSSLSSDEELVPDRHLSVCVGCQTDMIISCSAAIQAAAVIHDAVLQTANHPCLEVASQTTKVAVLSATSQTDGPVTAKRSIHGPAHDVCDVKTHAETKAAPQEWLEIHANRCGTLHKASGACVFVPAAQVPTVLAKYGGSSR